MYTRYKLQYRDSNIYFYLPDNHGIIFDDSDLHAYLASLGKSEFTFKDINNACIHIPCLISRDPYRFPSSLSEGCS